MFFIPVLSKFMPTKNDIFHEWSSIHFGKRGLNKSAAFLIFWTGECQTGFKRQSDSKSKIEILPIMHFTERENLTGGDYSKAMWGYNKAAKIRTELVYHRYPALWALNRQRVHSDIQWIKYRRDTPLLLDILFILRLLRCEPPPLSVVRVKDSSSTVSAAFTHGCEVKEPSSHSEIIL
jgi:hypothetical protein